MSPLRCGCGAEAIPGDLFTDADRVAWERDHAACGPADVTPSSVTIRCASEAEARALVPDLRPLFVVGRTGAALFCKPRTTTLHT